MRRPRTAGGVLLALAATLAATGCLGRGLTLRSAEWFQHVRTAAELPQGLHIRTVLVDQPAGDPYLNKGLWATAESPVSHAQATLLAQNGLRVGVIAGLPPGEFSALVNSDHHTLNRMFRTMKPEAAKVVAVNGPTPRCSFRVLNDLVAEPTRFELGDAECGLSVTAAPQEDGRVALHCEWQVQHGDRQMYLNPTDDGAGFTRRDHKPRELFPTLNFDVTLGANDSLVVGMAGDPADTLGEAFFVAAAPDRVRQRVLVIQAGNTTKPAEPAKK